jgi:hypothetical protein
VAAAPDEHTCVIFDSGKCAVATSGDFTLVNKALPGQGLGDGINERYVGEFDLTTILADYLTFLDPTYYLQSAMVEVDIIPVIDANNDGFWLGNILVDNDVTPVPSSQVPYGLSDPTPVTLTFNLLDYYTRSEITDFITGGDEDGKLWIRLADDHFVNSATLTVVAAEMPEPASLILLGTGLVGMAAWRSRKTRQNQ